MEYAKGKRAIDQAFNKAAKKNTRKRTLIWLLICLVISVAVSLVLHFVPVWYDKFVNYHDPFYRPMDIERKFQTLEQDRGSVKK